MIDGGFAVTTPLWDSEPLARALGVPVYLKMEALQPCGSFKIRGLGAVCAARVAAGARRLLCSSGGNAGLAVAYAGRRLGVPVTVVVPRSTTAWARERIAAEGAAVVEHGAAWAEAHAYALENMSEGTAYVHPFDDPEIWEGHAPMIDEAAVQLASYTGEPPGAVVVAVGGGGLLCGVLLGMQRVGWGAVPVLAVETTGAASLAAAIAADALVSLAKIDTLATTLGAARVAAEALAWTRRRSVQAWQVSDGAAVVACERFLDDHRVLVEPACGAGLSAIYDAAAPLRGRSSVLVIVCGGAGVSLALLRAWVQATRGA
ncbi:MAG: pyridoxal-phosphate dependent enzyme [Nannocystis sp.]|uniref:pyridoxal-phosphate dependent enzyme n=1 Tax=Nannocystis sp. TaxID=1962667 RepID=UPI002425F3D8|nr:pyridoxal-phosphate dependent enzyme [Nannocystis sp.]MBK9756522.1 pyridoxal-phosphate dependent enzyme [Nannocystis sp.]